ncbi:hypothetical protein BDY21DRAFT_40321 [Lineolata rhizophorae]|uniref:Uncharacterized protein n=1 Tax=Lineolata rhizophorae TaxID=578093 RepID=A0A6A6NYS0_9PEZI|nr:hypothetical protein BDY21DRAFT_40321 [Lineolata rhizophorae]
MLKFLSSRCRCWHQTLARWQQAASSVHLCVRSQPLFCCRCFAVRLPALPNVDIRQARSFSGCFCVLVIFGDRCSFFPVLLLTLRLIVRLPLPSSPSLPRLVDSPARGLSTVACHVERRPRAPRLRAFARVTARACLGPHSPVPIAWVVLGTQPSDP